jgi:hypothetical protein
MQHASQVTKRCSIVIIFKSGQRLTTPWYIIKDDAHFLHDFMIQSLSQATTINELMTMNDEFKTISKLPWHDERQ